MYQPNVSKIVFRKINSDIFFEGTHSLYEETVWVFYWGRKAGSFIEFP